MTKRLVRTLVGVVAFGLAGAALADPVPADSPQTVLHSFDGDDGALPAAGVAIGRDGALYGTTSAGGAHSGGTVFRLTPPTAGGQSWTKTILHDFAGNGFPNSDGAVPTGEIVIDNDGALFGTTSKGGASDDGIVFTLNPPASDGDVWTYAILHQFSGANGARPNARLTMDAGGTLYGTTTAGGAFGLGTVFKLARLAPGDTWTETVLYSFRGGSDGATPHAGVIMDQAGALYGTTQAGGAANLGTAFKLTPPSSQDQAWTASILHNFSASDDAGHSPLSGLVSGDDGGLYGTTNVGAAGFGAVFKLTPPVAVDQSWTKTSLHAFAGPSDDGANPINRLVAHRHGVLFGTTSVGGGNLMCAPGCGTVFKLTPPAPGGENWTEAVVFDFRSPGDAIYPMGDLALDANGFLYGASFYGGAPGWGAIYVFRPFFPATAITSATATSAFATRPLNLFAYPGLIGRSAWYAYGRVLELATSGDLSYDLLTTMPAAFALQYAPFRSANRWPARLPGHWIATGPNDPLPVDRRRIGLLAVYDGPLPHGHVGVVEEISVDKKRFRMSEFDRTGNAQYGSNWYYFDSADGGPDAGLASTRANASRRWYPKFFDPGDPNW